MLLATGFDDAIIGIGSRCGQPDVVVYDTGKIIDTLMQRDGMEEDEAWEHFDFNIQGAWVGDNTPMFVRRADAQQVHEEADNDLQMNLAL